MPMSLFLFLYLPIPGSCTHCDRQDPLEELHAAAQHCGAGLGGCRASHLLIGMAFTIQVAPASLLRFNGLYDSGNSPQETVHRNQCTGNSPQRTVHRKQSTGNSPQGKVHKKQSTGNSQGQVHIRSKIIFNNNKIIV